MIYTDPGDLSSQLLQLATTLDFGQDPLFVQLHQLNAAGLTGAEGWGKEFPDSQLVARGGNFSCWSCETLGGMTGFFLKVMDIIKPDKIFDVFFFFDFTYYFLVERVDYACSLCEHL